MLNSSFFNINLTSFLPGSFSFFLPLILGFIGFYLIRIEFSGVRTLDILNKNINSRKIKMHQMHRDEALEAFKIWDKKKDKIKY